MLVSRNELFDEIEPGLLAVSSQNRVVRLSEVPVGQREDFEPLEKLQQLALVTADQSINLALLANLRSLRDGL